MHEKALLDFMLIGWDIHRYALSDQENQWKPASLFSSWSKIIAANGHECVTSNSIPILL